MYAKLINGKLTPAPTNLCKDGTVYQNYNLESNAAMLLADGYKPVAEMPAPDEMKKRFASLDRMKYREKWWVIDVGGGNLRVMFFADFERGKIFIKHITTHAEYDKLTDFYRRTKE